MDEKTIWLVNAETRNGARSHVVAVNKASAANVADVLGNGGKVEQAGEA